MKSVKLPFNSVRNSTKLTPPPPCATSSVHEGIQLRRRGTLIGLSSILSTSLCLNNRSEAGPFLKETGGRGPLAEEEARLLEIRVRKEKEFDEEVVNSKEGKFCATPFGIDVVGITEFIALIGALVGGLTARRRKAELERLNERLRRINMSLRQNARFGIVYAPGLTYAPIGDSTVQYPINDAESTEMTAKRTATALLGSVDEELTDEQRFCRDALRVGKKLLKTKNASAAMVRFEKALMLARGLNDKTQERRAVRGLAACARLLGDFRAAIKHLECVLEISDETDDHVGDSDAYGTIADIYTELGEFEKAAEYYDKYISRMNTDGPV
eukprot:g5067.t1